jgi:hypothetical protein
MYRNLTVAWYCLGIFVLWIVSFLILMPFIGADRAVLGSTGWFGLLGFLPLFPLIFRKEKYDERDITFLRQALAVGFCFGLSTCFAFTVTVAFSCQFLLGRDSVPIAFMWSSLLVNLIVSTFTFSMRILHLYHRGELPNAWEANQ